MHLTGPAEVPDSDAWRHRPVRADFARLLTGAQSGRSHADDVLLVELLGTGRLDVGLASTLHRAARDHGVGVEVVESPHIPR
jgi:ornithine cyclodeaminase/alanine dehydrogenase-like protein (mu-crystallin family)